MANGPARDSGYNTYASDGTSKFTPLIFSKKVLRNYYAMTAFSEISNTDYQGEIKAQGDKVLIRTTPAITINPYVVGGTLTYEVPEKANKELMIDQALSWSFRIDDIDEVQTDLNLMNTFAADAAERLKISIDTNCFTYAVGKADSNNRGATAGVLSNISMGAAGGSNGSNALSLTADNTTDFIVDVNVVLDEQSIPSMDRWIVL